MSEAHGLSLRAGIPFTDRDDLISPVPGFGDVVPGKTINEKETQTYRLASCAIYLLFGMALIAMSFNLVQEEVKKTVRNIGKRIGIVSDDDD